MTRNAPLSRALGGAATGALQGPGGAPPALGGSRPGGAAGQRDKRGARALQSWRNRITGHADVPPDQLLANPANWRSHPREQQRALSAALGEVGWVAQVMVNTTTGHVVDGHLRVELALSRNEPTVPVTYVELTEDEERLVLATLDPLAAMATAEKDALEALLAGLQPEDDVLASLLRELGEEHGIHRHLLGDPDELPPVPDEADVYVKPGDLWLLGDHRLLCGDATDPVAVARLLDGAEPRLLSTDPPYGVSLDPRWRDGLYNDLGPAEQPYMRIEGHRNTTLSGDTGVDWSAAFELVPSLEVGYVWHGGVHAAEVAAGLQRIGFEVASQVIWDKGLFAMSRGWYHWGHEPCWVVRRPGVPNLFQGDRDQSTVWRAPSPKMIMGGSDEEKMDHPAQKPVLLSEIPIRNHLRAGEIVYDPFLGSGTTLVAAGTLGRRCYGLEIDPCYRQLIIDRWQGLTGGSAGARRSMMEVWTQGAEHDPTRHGEPVPARRDGTVGCRPAHSPPNCCNPDKASDRGDVGPDRDQPLGIERRVVVPAKVDPQSPVPRRPIDMALVDQLALERVIRDGARQARDPKHQERNRAHSHSLVMGGHPIWKPPLASGQSHTTTTSGAPVQQCPLLQQS
jgi:DNA modification methylase